MEENSVLDINEQNKVLNFICKHYFSFFIINSILLACSFAVLTTLTFLYDDELNNIFWVNQISKYIFILIIQYLMALLVIHKNVKVNYTRKVIHVLYFIWPQILDVIILKYDKDIYTELWNIWVILFLLYIVSEPIRNNIRFLDMAFKAVDRPEDKPYTLIWFSTQIISTLIIIISFSIYFNYIDKNSFIFIPILINALGDGLAEPVGIRFGKHKYETRACLSVVKYERSYEGSFCVFIVSTIIILAYYEYMITNQYIFNILTIPIMTTFTEAYSPHTWDGPCITFIVCILLTISNFIT